MSKKVLCLLKTTNISLVGLGKGWIGERDLDPVESVEGEEDKEASSEGISYRDQKLRNSRWDSDRGTS